MKSRNLFILAVIAAIILLAAPFVLLSYRTTGNSVKVDGSGDLEFRFASLSSAKTNFCAGPDILDRISTDRLQGSCCSAMDFHRYQEQLLGLERYSYIGKIPKDPYDIPVSLAKELLDFQKTIRLSAEQQAVYDEAVRLSHEGGPCCCKCWRWYAFEGLAKYLISEYDFNAEQIAEVWDLEDGCGGTGHAHNT